MKAAGWLHDTIEDTDTEYADLVEVFYEDIAELVYCVSNEEGKNRKERAAKTYPKIRSNSGAVALKLADRITNVENCILTDNSKLAMYRKEYPDFKKALYREGEYALMWKWLDFLSKG
jgi:(p)ppGpp synthase/HD superfamily hydrolase